MRYSKVRDVKSPERGTSRSAGIDFFIPNDFKRKVVFAGEDILIPSGIKVDIPEGYMLMAADKSGIVTSSFAMREAGRKPKPDAFESSVIIGAKIVDKDYQGEVHIHLINVGNERIVLTPGMKIAQFILVPVSYQTLEEVPESELFSDTTERGEGGFGSTN
jgi:dUTP pyrophosphatase